LAQDNMPRIYGVQNGFNFADRQREDAWYEIERRRRCAGFSGVMAARPDETTMLNFCHFF